MFDSQFQNKQDKTVAHNTFDFRNLSSSSK